MQWTPRRVLKDDDFTVVTWRQMLVDGGGMPEPDFAAFVSYWKGWIAQDDSGLFEHETEGWYAAPHLIPQPLRDAYPKGGCLIPLKNKIHDILDDHFYRREFATERIPEIRAEIDKAVADWVATYAEQAAQAQEGAKSIIVDRANFELGRSTK